jgi:PPM family protein phosphatase
MNLLRTDHALIQLDIAARTHAGLKRDNNEDQVLVADLIRGRPAGGGFDGRLEVGDGGVLLAVCDGIGGNAGGEVASGTAVTELYRQALGRLPGRSLEAAASTLFDCVRGASQHIEQLARAQPALRGMGTTATVCTLAGDSLIVAHVGDCRAYLLRGGELVRLTRDQTLMALLLERGQLTPEEASRFEYAHVILQALGSAQGVEIELGTVPLARDDVLLLCSDGLYGCVADDAIAGVLSGQASTAHIVDQLLALGLEAGAPDNLSCVVARFGGALPARTEPPALERFV